MSLKPCPFCGRAPEVASRASSVNPTGEAHFVACMCGGHGARAHVHGYSAEHVLELWNTRHGEAQLLGLLQQMLDVAENADETGYVDGVGFVDLDKLHGEVRAALGLQSPNESDRHPDDDPREPSDREEQR